MTLQQSTPPKTNFFSRYVLDVYIWSIAFLGVLLVIESIIITYPLDIYILIFVGLVAFAEILTQSNLFAPEMVFSISSAVTFATLMLFGPYVAAIAAGCGGITLAIILQLFNTRGRKRQSSLMQRIFFNMAAFSIPAAVAGWVYIGLGGDVGRVDVLSNTMPVVLAAITLEFVNAILVIGAVAIQTHLTLIQVWQRNVSWTIPIDILTMAVGGWGMAYAFEIARYVGLMVFFVPIAMTIYAVRLYVEQTKQQMDKLEQTVEERTADLRKAYEELKQLDQTKTAFFSIVNHEMRSPLTAIIGYAGLLLRDDTLSEDQYYQVSAIESNSKRIIELVNNILDIARIEDGKLRITPGDTFILPLVYEAVKTIHPMADKKKITINVDTDIGSDAMVYADGKRIEQVIINLLSNAVKYTPETGSVQVTAQISAEEQMLKVEVIDNGVGIPMKVLPVIFDRFSRAERDDIRGISGTGLGLAIVKGVVEAHHGKVWADSIEGSGSTFGFSIPLSAEQWQTTPATDATDETESQKTA